LHKWRKGFCGLTGYTYSFRNVQSSSFSRPAVVAHALESWKLLTKTYSYLREVSTLMVEFVSGVLGSYLKKPRYMCELSQAWVQSREVLRLICQTPSTSDILSSLLTTVDELKMR
ncbi:hypothetical protein ANCCAN_21036, partial [Ancylostoma caninum]